MHMRLSPTPIIGMGNFIAPKIGYLVCPYDDLEWATL